VQLALQLGNVDSSTDVKNLIKGNKLLGAHLTKEQVDKLVEKSVEMIIEKDHLLTRIQQKPNQLYIITRGVGQELNGAYKEVKRIGDVIAEHSLVQNLYITSISPQYFNARFRIRYGDEHRVSRPQRSAPLSEGKGGKAKMKGSEPSLEGKFGSLLQSVQTGHEALLRAHARVRRQSRGGRAARLI